MIGEDRSVSGSEASGVEDPRLLLLDGRDNVLVAIKAIGAAEASASAVAASTPRSLSCSATRYTTPRDTS